jgi:hypothetical protein
LIADGSAKVLQLLAQLALVFLLLRPITKVPGDPWNLGPEATTEDDAAAGRANVGAPTVVPVRDATASRWAYRRLTIASARDREISAAGLKSRAGVGWVTLVVLWYVVVVVSGVFLLPSAE